MRFAAPQFFWLMLVVLPVLGVFLIWSWRTKQRLITQFVQSRLLANLTVGVSRSLQILRLWLVVAVVGFLFLALTRPQWGYAWEEAKQRGLDIIVAIDTSRSMLAEDVPPNRLSRAKLAALDLLKQCKSDRLGLVSFAGTAFLQAPLTLDEEAFRQSVNALEVGIIPEGGTALSAAIETALGAFDKDDDNHKVLVLFTDGEDHDSDSETLEMAKKAAKAGMRIFTVGVGTPEGELLRVKDESGNLVFVKDDQDNAVKSRLNETLLRKISTDANGFYLPLRGANPMETLYQRGLAPLPKTDAATRMAKVYKERYHWPLGLAILCIMLELFVPERKPGKRPTLQTENGIRKAVVAIAVLFIPFAGFSSPSGAMREYKAGKFDAAFEEYERLSEKNTNDYRLHYNAGTAAYKAKQLEAAEKHLTQALNSPEIASDLSAQQHAYYNLGNTQFQLGAPLPDPEKKQELWEESIQNYDRALKLDPKDTNASNNLQFVKKALEELKKQQQQQQQQQGKNDKSKDQKDKDQQNQQDQNQKDQKDQKEQKKEQQNADKQQNQQQSQSGDKKDQQGQQDKKKQEQQQKKQAQRDKEKQDQAQAQETKEKKGGKGDDQEAAAGQMTLQQAKRILDAQQEDEKALIFSPENKPHQQRNRHIQDW